MTDLNVRTSFSLFEAGYKPPVGGDVFLKMAKAGTPIKFVPCGTTATGFSYWTNDKKCIRSPKRPTETPNIRVDDKGKVDSIKHYWAMPVFDCESKSVRILEITQSGIQQAITAIDDGSDYDLSSMQQAIKVSAIGSGFDTKYTVLVVPFKADELPVLLEAMATSEIIERGAAAVLTDMGEPKANVTTASEPAVPVISKAAAQDMM